jgi:hypothetical protein
MWSLVRDKFPKEWHTCRLENTVGSGMFDINCCHAGKEAWIDLKAASGNWIVVKNSQRTFAHERHRAGNDRTFFLVRREDELLLYQASDVVAAQYTPLTDGKGFRVNLNHVADPLLTTHKPFDWNSLWANIFGNGGD